MIFFTFLFFWISIQFGQIVEDSIAYGMVLSLGVIHGANDLVILRKQHQANTQFLKSVAGYGMFILLCVLSFLIDPYISLILFIVLSAYHFGEQHLEKKLFGPLWLKSCIYLLYGVIIFFLLFIENMNDVDQIVNDLSSKYFSLNMILALLIGSSILLILAFLYSYYKKYQLKINWVKEVFYLGVLYLVFKTSSLMLGFAIYFIFWHSIPSIIDQTKYLSGTSSKYSLISYFKTAGIIWIISILSLVLAYFYEGKELFSSIIFLILFAVTAPHVWVMYRMKKSANE